MIRALTLIVLGTASFAAVYVLVPPRDVPTDVAEAPTASLAAPTAETEIAPASVQEAAMGAEDPMTAIGFELRPGPGQVMPESGASHAVRDVTPDNMTAAPRVTGTLSRADPPAPPPARERTERLFNPIVIAAGTIKVRNREIHLAGVTAPEFEKSCGKGATAWPCGRLARAALRSFIRGRAIECRIPAGANKIPDPATCVVGGDDISEWLVAQGWAKRSGENFADAETKARDAKLGLWSEGRPDVQTRTASARG